MRAISLTSLNRYEEAIEAFKKVTEVNPTYFSAWNLMGSVNFLMR